MNKILSSFVACLAMLSSAFAASNKGTISTTLPSGTVTLAMLASHPTAWVGIGIDSPGSSVVQVSLLSGASLTSNPQIYFSGDNGATMIERIQDSLVQRVTTSATGAIVGNTSATYTFPAAYGKIYIVEPNGGSGLATLFIVSGPPASFQPASGSSGTTVIANAGTNLNTSPLALETGGNLATIATNTTGVATSAKQDTGNTSLSTIASNTTSIATSAKQDTGNTSLSTLVSSLASLLTQLGTVPYDAGNIMKANMQLIYEADPTFTLGQTQSGGRMDSKGTLLVNPGALSNTTDSVAIGDGTNIAKVTAGDINAVGVGSGSLTGTLTLTGSQSANAALVDPVTTLAYVDMKGYSALTVHTTGLGTSATSVAFFGSNDASHWVSTGALNNNYSTGGSQATTSSTTSGFTLMGGYRYYQIQITGSQSAGTTTVAYNLKGTSPVTAYSTAFAPTVGTTGGITNVYNNSALSNSALGVKTSGAGNVYAYTFHNPDATNDATILLYNIAYGSVTVGTSTPIFYITLAPGASANMAFPFPLTCGTQISIAAVKGDSISGTSAPNTAIQAWVGYN